MHFHFISTKVHAVMDYLVATLLIIGPWFLEYDVHSAGTFVPVGLGIIVFLYSLFTDYEFGMYRRISVGTHLTLDMLSGLTLAVSPWLFGFYGEVFWPHLIFGLLALVVAMCTERNIITDKAAFNRPQPEHKL